MGKKEFKYLWSFFFISDGKLEREMDWRRWRRIVDIVLDRCG